MTWELISGRRAGGAVLAAMVGAGVLMLGGCSSANVKHEYPEQIGGSDQHDPLGRSTNTDEQVGSLLDKDGLIGGVFKKDGKDGEDKGEVEQTAHEATEDAESKGEHERLARMKNIGVNSYLWRASLETLSFMPLNSADPYGGVIITDWHVNPQAPQERFKVTVYVLDKALRADGVKVSVFRQVRSETGVWANAPAAEETGTEIEKAILTRARQLRVADLDE